MLKVLWPYIVATVCLVGGASEFFAGYRGEGTTSIRNVGLVSPRTTASPDFSEREIGCLTRVVYNESRNQPIAGQRAVAAVVINRSLSARWQATNLCSIAKAKRQFHWSVPPAPRNSLDRRALVIAEEVARYVTANYGGLSEEMRSFVFFDKGKAPRDSTTIGDHNFYG